MPWCPLCKTEYRDGFSVCNDCNVDLVEALQPDTEEEDDDTDDELDITAIKSWTFLKSMIDDSEALIIESFLRSSGIPVWKKYKGAGAVLKVYQMEPTKFPVDLFVPENLYPQAKELLAAGYETNDDSDNSERKPGDSGNIIPV